MFTYGHNHHHPADGSGRYPTIPVNGPGARGSFGTAGTGANNGGGKQTPGNGGTGGTPGITAHGSGAYSPFAFSPPPTAESKRPLLSPEAEQKRKRRRVQMEEMQKKIRYNTVMKGNVTREALERALAASASVKKDLLTSDGEMNEKWNEGKELAAMHSELIKGSDAQIEDYRKNAEEKCAAEDQKVADVEDKRAKKLEELDKEVEAVKETAAAAKVKIMADTDANITEDMEERSGFLTNLDFAIATNNEEKIIVHAKMRKTSSTDVPSVLAQLKMVKEYTNLNPDQIALVDKEIKHLESVPGTVDAKSLTWCDNLIDVSPETLQSLFDIRTRSDAENVPTHSSAHGIFNSKEKICQFLNGKQFSENPHYQFLWDCEDFRSGKTENWKQTLPDYRNAMSKEEWNDFIVAILGIED